MTKFGKWLGGGLGWAMGGPIGALIGFALGAVLDDSGTVARQTNTRYHSQRGDFSASLLILVAAVLKADGTVLKAELEFIKKFYVKHFGVESTREQMLVLKDLLQKEIPLDQVCAQIRANMEYAGRLELIHFLFGLSQSDGQVHPGEVHVIEQIAAYLKIQEADYLSIKAMFLKDSESDYKILEISKEATEEEIRKAYRKMAMKYHPDKVLNLGPEIQKDAQDKFLKVQQAYENIRKARGMK